MLPTIAWRTLSVQVTAIPDPVYPADPAVIKAIHTFDPTVIPLWMRHVYQASTGEILVRGFHAFGVALWNPRLEPGAWTNRVLTPTTGRPVHVTNIALELKDEPVKRPKGIGRALAARYLPFDWRWVNAMHSCYQEWTAKQVTDYIVENDRAAVAQRERTKDRKSTRLNSSHLGI